MQFLKYVIIVLHRKGALAVHHDGIVNALEGAPHACIAETIAQVESMASATLF